MLILGGVSGAGMMATMTTFRPYLIGVTFGFLGLAFYLTYRPRKPARAATSRFMTANKVMLWSVTIVAGVFLFCPQIFSGLQVSDGVTAEMNRAVLKVEGMTCPG